MDNYIYTYHCGMLKMFSNYQASNTGVHFHYDHDAPQLKVLKEKYEIEKVAGGGDTFQQALSLMRWVNANIYHNDNAVIEPYHSLAILDHCFQKEENTSLVCFCLAVVLNECLLSIGIKSRILHLYPANPYEFDSHVVVMAYIQTLNKWIMLDPTYNCYCMDKDNHPLSPWEIRMKLAEREIVICNEDMHNNGVHQSAQQATIWRTQYYAKNMFFMYSTEINTFHSELFPQKEGYLNSQRNVYLCPEGFDPFQFELEKMKFCGWEEDYHFIKNTKAHRIVLNFAEFTKIPE